MIPRPLLTLNFQRMSDDKNRYIPTEEDRLHQYFSQLASVLPNPPKDWAKAARLCKWDRMLKERQNKCG